MLTVITDKPILNKKYYVRRAVTPGKWLEFATTAGGFAIEWFRNVAFMDMDISTFYRNIYGYSSGRHGKQRLGFTVFGG